MPKVLRTRLEVTGAGAPSRKHHGDDSLADSQAAENAFSRS
jgi:hypothetical protein